MRSLPPSFDPFVVAQIDARLDDLQQRERVVLPLAVESGSRAWGFPSPDSDYDCRFVYVRTQEDYLGLWPRRDVIETPLDDVLDVNGWDLRKALQLMVRGNAVILEWLGSPVVYRGDPAFVAACAALASRVTDRGKVARHYLHIGAGQWARARSANGELSLKKSFYALRPALALRWLRTNPSAAVPPMTLGALVDGSDLAQRERAVIEDLVALKARTTEAGSVAVPREVVGIIARELTDEAWMRVVRPPEVTRDALALGDEFFRATLGTLGSGGSAWVAAEGAVAG